MITRLRLVQLSYQVVFKGERSDTWTDEAGELYYEPERGVVTVPWGELIPMHRILRMVPAPRGWPCDVDGCGFRASDPRGLGAHKKGAHDIGGTSPGRSAAK